MCAGLLTWLILMIVLNLPEKICGYSESYGYDSCMTSMNTLLYVCWAICAVIVLPIQFFIINVFKAYRDELEEEKADDYVPANQGQVHQTYQHI